MKNLIPLIAATSLAACNPAPQAAPTAPPIAADGKPSPGLYRVTDAAGTVLIENLHPDGSYTFMDEAGTILETGQWTQKSPTNLCFTANADNAPEICYNEAVRADGIWYSTKSGTTDTATIERLEN